MLQYLTYDIQDGPKQYKKIEKPNNPKFQKLQIF